MRDYGKVQLVLFGFTSNSHLQINCKFTDIVISDLYITFKFKSGIKRSVSITIYFQAWSACFAESSYDFVGIKIIVYLRENLIEISCKELEHSISPSFFFEVCI